MKCLFQEIRTFEDQIVVFHILNGRFKMSNKINMKTVDGLKQFVAFKGYDSTTAYSLNDVVVSIQNDEVKIYQSLADSNTTSLSDTTKWKEVELGGAIDIDNDTISLNSNEEIQTIGVIDSNNNTTALKLWTGTRSQYNAIQNKDPNTLYNLTDDTGDLSEFANTDLSNLSTTGEAHFTNPDLSNLSSTGEAHFTNPDLSNLSVTGEAHFTNPALTNSPYTTNRILAIPQDIKLELVDGTLTLKAGSKVYVPNGFEEDGTTPKFDVVQIENDITIEPAANSSGKALVTVNYTGTASAAWDVDICSTGTTDAGNNTVRYNTATNLVVRTDSSGGKVNHSFPIALINMSGTTFVSIDQVFNGFGYIGSTVFALPGVKGTIPNGRNEDGTCKTTLTTLTSVKARTFTDAAQRGWYLQTNIGASSGNSPVYSDTQPSQNYIRWFSQKDNQWYDTHESPELNSKTYILPLASFNTDSTGKITSFEPYTVDSVVNSNEFYQFKDEIQTNKSNTDLSNLSAAGEAKLKSNIQLVNELPANPEEGVLYCIAEG